MFQSAPAPAVRTGTGVGNSGRQADYEFRAGAGPSLWAAMLPPCNSTKDFTRARPSPSPRTPFSPRPGPARTVEHPRQQVRGDPPAVVPHPQDGLPGFRLRGQPDVPARVGELGRVSQQVGQHLLQPNRVGHQGHWDAGSETVSRCPHAASRCAVASAAPATTAARSTTSLQSGRLSGSRHRGRRGHRRSVSSAGPGGPPS